MLGPSLSLGKIFGIPVRLHWTFLLLLIWVALTQISLGASFGAALAGVAFLAAIFACVVLHELGHCFVARHYGIATKHITLSPLGGVAALEASPRNWKEEFWVAVAGPAVNLMICLVLLPWIVANPVSLAELAQPSTSFNAFVAKLLIGNIVMVIFNLIPAFPMDGGRILRALLEARRDRLSATRIAARMGQVFAVLFALVGLSISFVLVVIGIFIFLGAEAEYRMVESHHRLKGVPVSELMRTRVEVVESTEVIGDALRKTAWYGQDSFPVLENGTVVAMLDRTSIRRAASKNDLWAPVKSYAVTDYAMAIPSDDLATVQDLIARTGQLALPVLEAGNLVGLIDHGTIAGYYQLPVREVYTRATVGDPREYTSSRNDFRA